MTLGVLDAPTIQSAEQPYSARDVFARSSAVVKLLKQTTAYADRPTSLSLIETHVSWVFLTDRFAYKLKKPVRFEFVDFSEPEARRRACLAECALNDRMARGVYLGVLPITVDALGRLKLNGPGRVIDWVVKMRRLPADRMLDRLLRARQLSETDAERLTTWLAGYYDRLSPLFMDAASYCRSIEERVLANRLELLDPSHALPVELVKHSHAAQLRFLALWRSRLEDRVCDGRLVDGHGDLRPEHVCLEHEPLVFDCLEFSEQLRHVDVVDELAFLAMECDCLGAEQLARQIRDKYRKISGDRFPPALWNFYQCYRACVRAKVSALAAAQQDSPRDAAAYRRARNYLARADRYARRLGPPGMIVVCGLMGSGKTTLATALAESLGSDLLSTDQIRRETLGASPTPAAFNSGHYAPELRRRVYGEMFRRAGMLLQHGISVVLDGAFLAGAERRAARSLARASGAAPLFVRCVCPAAVALERIERRAARASPSEGRGELYASQRSAEEPFDECKATEVDTTLALSRQKAAVFDALKRRLGDSDTASRRK